MKNRAGVPSYIPQDMVVHNVKVSANPIARNILDGRGELGVKRELSSPRELGVNDNELHSSNILGRSEELPIKKELSPPKDIDRFRK